MSTPEGKSKRQVGQAWVYARKRWQDSGVHVSAGQKFSITMFWYDTRGEHPYDVPDVLWRVNNDHKYYGLTGTGVSAPAGYALPGASEGSLVYRIGDGPARSALDPSPYTADQSGQIYLIANDDLRGDRGDGFSDNHGRLDIRIYFH